MNPIDLYSVKRRLENVRCPDCDQPPVITIAEDVISYKCCCDAFTQIISELIPVKMQKQKSKQIDNIFR